MKMSQDGDFGFVFYDFQEVIWKVIMVQQQVVLRAYLV